MHLCPAPHGYSNKVIVSALKKGGLLALNATCNNLSILNMLYMHLMNLLRHTIKTKITEHLLTITIIYSIFTPMSLYYKFLIFAFPSN